MVDRDVTKNDRGLLILLARKVLGLDAQDFSKIVGISEKEILSVEANNADLNSEIVLKIYFTLDQIVKSKPSRISDYTIDILELILDDLSNIIIAGNEDLNDYIDNMSKNKTFHISK